MSKLHDCNVYSPTFTASHVLEVKLRSGSGCQKCSTLRGNLISLRTSIQAKAKRGGVRTTTEQPGWTVPQHQVFYQRPINKTDGYPYPSVDGLMQRWRNTQLPTSHHLSETAPRCLISFTVERREMDPPTLDVCMRKRWFSRWDNARIERTCITDCCNTDHVIQLIQFYKKSPISLEVEVDVMRILPSSHDSANNSHYEQSRPHLKWQTPEPSAKCKNGVTIQKHTQADARCWISLHMRCRMRVFLCNVKLATKTDLGMRVRRVGLLKDCVLATCIGNNTPALEALLIVVDHEPITSHLKLGSNSRLVWSTPLTVATQQFGLCYRFEQW